MARLRASGRTSLPVVQQPRNPQSESIARSPYDTASVAGSVLDEFYGDRERIGDLIAATDARMGAQAFKAVIRREAGRRAALGRLKTLLRIVRRERFRREAETAVEKAANTAGSRFHE